MPETTSKPQRTWAASLSSVTLQNETEQRRVESKESLAFHIGKDAAPVKWKAWVYQDDENHPSQVGITQPQIWQERRCSICMRLVIAARLILVFFRMKDGLANGAFLLCFAHTAVVTGKKLHGDDKENNRVLSWVYVKRMYWKTNLVLEAAHASHQRWKHDSHVCVLWLLMSTESKRLDASLK